MLKSHVQKSVMPNGITVVTEKIPYVRSVALGVWITVGSRDESANDYGISHFLEHMLFKGTSRRNAQQIAESLEALGGSLDAFTTKELTCYNAHCLDEHLSVAVDVIADLIANSSYDTIELEKEKDVIINEINTYKDTPDDIIFDHYYEQVFAGHELAHHIYGNESNVRSFTRDQVLAFRNQEYGANRIVLSVTGNLTHEHVLSLVEEHFGMLSPAKLRAVEKLTEPEKPTRRIIPEHCNQAHVCMGDIGISYHDEDKFPFLILNTLLGGGMSSLLFQKIRETHGLVYTIYNFYDFFIDTGIWGIYFATDQKNIDQAIALIHEEMSILTKQPITADMLVKVKNQLKGGLILGLESIFSRMNRLSKNEIYLKQHFTLDDIIKRIDAVTPEHVLQMAQKLFQPDGFTYTIIQPTT
ncbi:insulinase family protein [candidate division KSB1 bacterium]|nr:insulinase family protein [candidate division KSB1 bacterium]